MGRTGVRTEDSDAGSTAPPRSSGSAEGPLRFEDGEGLRFRGPLDPRLGLGGSRSSSFNTSMDMGGLRSASMTRQDSGAGSDRFEMPGALPVGTPTPREE